jgi:hypothetical protein
MIELVCIGSGVDGLLMKPGFVVAYKEVWFVDRKLDVLATEKSSHSSN